MSVFTMLSFATVLWLVSRFYFVACFVVGGILQLYGWLILAAITINFILDLAWSKNTPTPKEIHPFGRHISDSGLGL